MARKAGAVAGVGDPHERVCPLHGPYEAARWSAACPAEFRVRLFVNESSIDIGCPGRTWRADDPPNRLARAWRGFCAWVNTAKDAWGASTDDTRGKPGA